MTGIDEYDGESTVCLEGVPVPRYELVDRLLGLGCSDVYFLVMNIVNGRIFSWRKNTLESGRCRLGKCYRWRGNFFGDSDQANFLFRGFFLESWFVEEVGNDGGVDDDNKSGDDVRIQSDVRYERRYRQWRRGLGSGAGSEP